MKGIRECSWCAGSDNDEPDTDLLCIDHLAEYEGLSVDQMERRDDEQAAEYNEWVLGR